MTWTSDAKTGATTFTVKGLCLPYFEQDPNEPCCRVYSVATVEVSPCSWMNVPVDACATTATAAASDGCIFESTQRADELATAYLRDDEMAYPSLRSGVSRYRWSGYDSYFGLKR